jgi:hypothetical protein
MTNPELNAWIDEHVFGVKPKTICNVNHDSGCSEGRCGRIAQGSKWEDCDYIADGAPDYCGDWAAFGRLMEWCESQGHAMEHERLPRSPDWCVEIDIDGGRCEYARAPSLQLALARAVYKAMKGKEDE